MNIIQQLEKEQVAIVAAQRGVPVFGAGDTVLVEGSNDGTNSATLNDPQGVALSKTAAALVEVAQITKFIRPRVSAGDGTTAITVTLLARKA